mmetsp:Transcript_25769/g.84897  ORF Transcript_25769/g.84897 Transcript_25769/m.84897 type:complete len:93 (+) Transcript_25769:114-392(+)
MSEAVRHARTAARLDPASTVFAARAKQLRGFEEALRKYREADRRSYKDREAAVHAMHRQMEEKREEEEEDEAVRAEEAAEEAARRRAKQELR